MHGAREHPSPAPAPAWSHRWLDDLGIGHGPDLVAERTGHGYSNLTYLLSDGGGRRWILRRPPPGDLVASAHDVVREARVMTALGPTAVPVPVVHGVRRDVRGVPWVLVEHVDGQVLDGVEAGRGLAAAQRRELASSMAGALARVHEVDVDEIGLGDLSSRSPYAARQLRRWTRQWEAVRTRALPGLEQVAARLARALPEQHALCLVHGDFHVGNVVTRAGRVVAVLDWELSTLGDPLADLGTLLAYWPAAGELPGADRSSVSTLPGSPDRATVVADYARASGRDVSAVAFWHVLGLWKVAIIAEGVRRRAVDQPGSAPLASVPSARDVETLVGLAQQVADDAGL